MAWAQNYEMIDTRYLQHGRDCLSACEELVRLRVALRHIRVLVQSNTLDPDSCKSGRMDAEEATCLRRTISLIAKEALRDD